LHQALYQSVGNDPAITWIAPVEAVGLALGEFAAKITLSDGREIEAALCVAAEGRQSKLREAAGIKTMGWGYAQRGIVATVQFELPHNGVAIQHFLPGGPFAVLPLKDNCACITWSSSDEEAERVLALDDAAFLDELDQRIGGRFGAIALIGKPQSWPLDVKIARELTAKRFALIGDAAHGVHPVAGQGVNLAFRDVAALVEVLTDAARIGLDLGNGPALERYARWRRFDSTMSAATYDGLNRIFSIDNAVLRAARGAGLGIVDQIPQLKQLIMTEAAGLSGDLPKLVRGERV
jgi:2-octaprenyl-6-methoxyphenol hydroxylase